MSTTQDFEFVTRGASTNSEPAQWFKLISVAKEKLVKEQDRSKTQADKGRRPAECCQPGYRVWVRTNILTSTARGVSSLKRNGPYEVLKNASQTSYEVL